MKINLLEIPALYINLEHYIEKNKNIQNILTQCGFKKIIRVEGVLRPQIPYAGCSAAHYKCLSGINPPFIIFEDDCEIKNFRSEIEVPDDADAVYLGVSSWARSNGHSGPFLKYKKVNEDLYQIYNMLGTHAILYLTKEYANICKRIAHHAGHLVDFYPDTGFAEIHRLFNVYAFNDPLFFQTSARSGTENMLTSYPVEDLTDCNKSYFLPTRII